MNAYHIFGSLNTVFIFVSLLGVYAQLNTIFQRKKTQQTAHQPTAMLSLNQFSVSFLAYFSFFIYGYSITPFNHFIVWPRLLASLLVTVILFQIWRDRKTRSSFWVITFAILALLFGGLGLIYGNTYDDSSRVLATILILIISVLIAQGYFHQIRLIIKSGITGAVNLRMSQFILLMDISTIAFALSMGLDNGWPLLVLAVTSGITKIIMMYLFYWVKNSPTAIQRAKQSDNL